MEPDMTEQNILKVTGAFRALIGLITAVEPIIETSMKAGSLAIVIVPRRQVNQVIGRQGAIVKALQSAGSQMARSLGFESITVLLVDPTPEQEAQAGAPIADIESIEARLETILDALGYSARVQGIPIGRQVTLSVNIGEAPCARSKMLTEAAIQGLNRNGAGAQQFTIVWQ